MVEIVIVLAFGIGVVAGLRAFTPLMLIAGFAYCGWIDLSTTNFSFMASVVTLGITTALAFGEYVGDVLPSTPKRTSPPALIARILTGALSGACLCAAVNRSTVIGASGGALGAVAGAFGAYNLRKYIVERLKLKDILVAIPEDIFAIGLGATILLILIK